MRLMTHWGYDKHECMPILSNGKVDHWMPLTPLFLWTVSPLKRVRIIALSSYNIRDGKSGTRSTGQSQGWGSVNYDRSLDSPHGALWPPQRYPSGQSRQARIPKPKHQDIKILKHYPTRLCRGAEVLSPETLLLRMIQISPKMWVGFLLPSIWSKSSRFNFA